MYLIVFQCRLGALIGSGEFGEVRRGIWACAAGRVEVAIKMMKREVKEEDKVKFLQEAAIMAQFKHPNVVTMHGMVYCWRTSMFISHLASHFEIIQDLF